MKNEEFIQRRLLEESQKLVEAEFYYPAFFLVSQGIETLGAFLDSKPLGAKQQSKKRFHKAVQELFPEPYQSLLEKEWLYKQLRCSISHLSSPGGFITLVSRTHTKKKHLQPSEGKYIFIIEDLVHDFACACEELIRRLQEGILKQKQMAFCEIDTLKP